LAIPFDLGLTSCFYNDFGMYGSKSFELNWHISGA